MAHAASLNTRAIALVATLMAALAAAGCGVNNIPTYEQQAKANWSEVLNQYKRRSDLIDNLVATVKGFAEQEKSVLTDVVEARAKATQAQINLPADILNNPEAMKKFQDAQNSLGGALGRLMVVVENIPILNPARTSSPCRVNSPARKTASPFRAATISRPFGFIIPS